MNLGLRIKLSLMMAFQYAVWSIWILMLYQRMHELKLDAQFGWIMMTTGLGSIIGPFVMGQLADRYFATEKVLAFAHIAGGLVLIATAYATTFWPIFLLMLVYCHLYFPTVGLTNSLAFRALGEGNQNQFPMIRFFGSIGWILGSWALAAYLNSSDAALLQPWFALPFVGKPSNMDILRFAGLISLVYGAFCFMLPHTPPIPAQAGDPLEKKSAFVESLGLMKISSFAVLVSVAGLIGVLLYYYFQNENAFLTYINTNPKSIGAYMTIGSAFELVSMVLIPLCMARLGTKRTMLLGAGAYVLMFGLKTIGQSWWALMIASNLCHGMCFGLFFVVAQMFVDKAASSDIKASAQSLMVFIVYGLANIVGVLLGNEVRTRFTVYGPDNITVVEQNWYAIWAVPLVLSVICLLIFAVFFKEAEIKKSPEPAGATVG
jgi:nucleoside transporter